MKEWWVWYDFHDSYEEETLVVLPSLWKVLLWFLLNAWKCRHIEMIIQYTGGKHER